MNVSTHELRRTPVPAPDELDEAGRQVYERIAAARGNVPLPFMLLLRSPELAARTAALGELVRFGISLPGALRELAILAVAVERRCGYEYDYHHDLALKSGVRADAIRHLTGEGRTTLTEAEAATIVFVRELCGSCKVSDATYEGVVDILGPEGPIDLSVLVGYYTLLACILGATEAVHAGNSMRDGDGAS